jgi:recombination protein RecR
VSGGPDPIERLVHHLSRLPGIGSRTATRLAFHLARSEELVDDLAIALLAVRDGVGRCSLCGDITASDPCGICSDSRRDASVLCVVAGTQDLRAIDKAGAFSGRFHVLGGVLSPLRGITPEELRISELLARLGDEVTEVILATNPTVEGDATALYLARLLKPLGVRVSRIARGVSVGAELEYTDSSTISRALEERREI